ncbi:hypothetical protein F5Y15DRAFT_410986 [Xylariaceae sp. FL0016]|nr:hypothetical protein F5Y15DRAFT_410986 [Xylariaceae sp. FL0016]
MGVAFLSPQQRDFDESRTRAWGLVRRHHGVVADAAKKLKTLEAQCVEEERHPSQHRLSALERLPDEILVHVMVLLDNESLYRLSQTTAKFLRLSFDKEFEASGDWRAFRHTVDALSIGPKRRILDGMRAANRCPVIGNSTWGSQDGTKSLLASDLRQQRDHIECCDVIVGGERVQDDEGESMISFMSKRF